MRFIITLFLIFLTSVAFSQSFSPFGQIVFPSGGGGSSSPVVGCNGTLDLSSGCPMPMLGGL